AVQAREVKTTLFCDRGDRSPGVQARHAELAHRGVDVQSVARGEAGLDLDAVLEQIRTIGVDSLLVEGGARLLTALYSARLVDRVVLVSAPVVIGAGTEAVGGLGVERLADAWRGVTRTVRQVGDDIVWEIDFVHER
ncbi:MAG: RibD family protein, partial [Spirochaetota bacterium]